jgi:hypothetical protein
MFNWIVQIPINHAKIFAIMITTNSLLQTLQEKHYIQVPFLMKRAFLEEAIQSFFNFLNEPDEVKDHINFSISPEHRRGDIGFKHRDPNDHIYNDSKDFFHFHPAIFEQYASFLNEHPAVNDFVLKANIIWQLAYDVTKTLLQTLDHEFPGTSEKVFKSQNDHFILRFLKYHWQKSDEYLAKPHFDAGSFTLAIAESSPGLRIGSTPDNMQLISHKDEHAIFMLSGNFKKLIDTDTLFPGWHDVIQLDSTQIGKPFARWAIVAFIDGHGVSAPPRSETHKWAISS